MICSRNLIRTKQRCRKIAYVVICFGIVIYTVANMVNEGKVDNGEESYRSRYLLGEDSNKITKNKKQEEQQDVLERSGNSTNHTECWLPSLADFPGDFFTNRQRKHGAAIVHVLVSIYMCVCLAIVCDYYFVPSLEVLCFKLNLQSDVAGASLMAVGSSAPELCASVIGVFLTKGDIGIGTILGSAVFNLLGVIGICGVCVKEELKLSWWPITRDTVAYCITIVVLSVVIFDSHVKWPEAMIMLLLYVVYIIMMWLNQRIEKKLYIYIGDTRSYQKRFGYDANEFTPIIYADKEKSPSETRLITDDDNDGDDDDDYENCDEKFDENASETSDTSSSTISEEEGYPSDPPEAIMNYPGTIFGKIAWLILLPITTTFFLTIPDLRRARCRRFVCLTFTMSIIWIGFCTYILVWMVTIVGFTLNIPDSVMGLTFVAFGSSVPDALASIIVAKQGMGDMAVSQALGSNVFDILLGLGLPWALKSMMQTDSRIKIQSVGMLISCFVTFILAMLVLLMFALRKFVLGRKLGVVLILAYIVYLIAAVATELMLPRDREIPMCTGYK